MTPFIMAPFMVPTPPEAIVFSADERFAWLSCPNDDVVLLALNDGAIVNRKTLRGVEKRRVGPHLLVGARLLPADLSNDGRDLPIDHDERVVGLSTTTLFIETRTGVRAVDAASFADLGDVAEVPPPTAPLGSAPRFTYLRSQIVVGETVYGTMLWNGHFELAVFPASARDSVLLEARGVADEAKVIFVEPGTPNIIVLHPRLGRLHLTAARGGPIPTVGDRVVVNGSSWLVAKPRASTTLPLAVGPAPAGP